MLQKSLFKAYDVRGVYPHELNESAAYLCGKAFAKLTGAKNVVIGQDARLSSPALFRALAQGLLESGVTVTSIGQLPTECVYFAVAQYDFDGAIMITASHNPKEYNGFKMIKKEKGDLVWVRGKDLLDIIVEQAYTPRETLAIIERDVLPDYIAFMSQYIDKKLKPFRVVVDASSGVMGIALSQIKHSLPFEIIELNFVPDGNFPHHSPNPLESGASDQIKQAILEHQADFGIMFDGDADRIFLVDEKGEVVSADAVLLLLAKKILQEHPGKGIAYNLICSKSVPELVTAWGGKAIRTQVGFVNVRDGLIQHDGILGGELSAHYCFRDYFYCDSGMMAFLMLLGIITQEDKPVSKIVEGLIRYVKSTANFEVVDKEGMIDRIRKAYTDGVQDDLDGLTIAYPDWWFNVRASNTEPLLRLTIEARDTVILEKHKKALENLIRTT